jgi:hypothetical protein
MRIHYVLPLFLLFACDKVQRDWSKCSDAAACAPGYTCSPEFRCVRTVDGGGADVAAPPADAGGGEVAETDTAGADSTADGLLDAPADRSLDAPADRSLGAPADAWADGSLDISVDGARDAAQADAPADLPVDTRPVDSQGSCSSDIQCPANLPMCLDFMCAKCASNNDCADRGDGGAGTGICDITSGRCVACVNSNECTADPAKPVCAVNQCVACTGNSQCSGRSDGGVSAAICDDTTGRCVACVKSSECTADPTKPVCAANQCVACTGNSQCSGRSDGGVTAGVCDTVTGRCVACVRHSECAADPAKPVCVANQCAPCQSAASPANECRARNSSAPVCDQNSGKCVGCLTNDHCTGSPDGGVDGGEDGGEDSGTSGGADGGVVAGFCYLATNQCVECLVHTDCKDASRPICGSAHTCVGCGAPGVSADSCATRNPALPVCKADTGTCVECTGNANCASDAGIRVCNPATNTCVECNDNTHCTADPAKAFCVNHACAGCQTAPAGSCTGPKPMCASSGGYSGQCVECNGNTDCKVGTKPVCDTNQCRACKKDLDCTGISPAVVCGLDGSCPGESSVIYLQNNTTCSTSARGDGTAAAPFCYADDAAAALSATKSVIVVRGTVGPLGPLTIAGSSTAVLIAGKSSANLRPPTGGSPPVIAITAGDVTLRDLTISNGGDAGVSVSGGATLRMDRCYVTGNSKNGIVTDNSAFDIVNTIIANNGGTNFSGVNLGAYTGTGPKRFAFNTVVNNGFGGVVCGGSYKPACVIAETNGGPNFSSACSPDSTSSTAAPALVSYRLTSSLPCPNNGGTTCPPDDIDGNPRPQGTACDCGADQYTSN